MILKENFYFFNYFEGLQPQNLHFIKTFFKKIHAAIFTFSDICVITSVAKDRKAPSGGKSRRREADDAAIFA